MNNDKNKKSTIYYKMNFMIKKLIEGYNADIKIKIQDELILSHKILISHASKFFEQYFTNWNNKNDIIDMNDTIIQDSCIFKNILQSWYKEQDIKCNVDQILTYKEYLDFLDSKTLLKPSKYLKESIIIKEPESSNFYSYEKDCLDHKKYPIVCIDGEKIDYNFGYFTHYYLILFEQPCIKNIMENLGFIYPSKQQQLNKFELTFKNIVCDFYIDQYFSLTFRFANIKYSLPIYSNFVDESGKIMYNKRIYYDVNITVFINKILDSYYQYINNNSYQTLFNNFNLITD